MFAGCGGFHSGMESAGFSTVFANDIDPRAKKTYDLNSKSCKLTVEDLNELYIGDLPEFDCLTAGFPCQPFSQAGKRLGFKDKTRGTLFHSIVEIIRQSPPEVFILENVKGLVGHDNGRTFETILDVLQNDLEYDVHYKVLNSMNYGVPQNRERIFIVGFARPTDFEFPEPIHLGITVKDLLDDEVDEKYYYRPGHKHYDVISKHVTDPDKVYQWRWSYVRENKKNVCPTMLASNMQPVLILTNKGIRTITPTEGYRLQGFPDDFQLHPELTDRDHFHQIGNSVSVPVIRALGNAIRERI